MASPKNKKQSVTAHGVTVTVDPAAFDDYELFETAFYGGSDMAILFKLMHAVCGDRYEEVKDGLRDENGRLSLETVSDFLTEVMQSIQALKN